jgi:hypothetical protein
MNSIDQVLNSIETMHNGTENEAEFDLIKAGNNQYYIDHLLKQNFVPSTELVELYGTYMNGKEDSWWCKSSLSFREFINTIKASALTGYRITSYMIRSPIWVDFELLRPPFRTLYK